MPYTPLLEGLPDAPGLEDDDVLCRYMDLAGLANLLLTRKLKTDSYLWNARSNRRTLV